jgi:hypothetical protein
MAAGNIETDWITILTIVIVAPVSVAYGIVLAHLL